MPANWKPIIQECRHFVPVIEGTHLGAGLLFSPDGLIVTNAHVVDDAGTPMVDLHDGTRAKGAMIHRDERGADLAIVRAAILTQKFYRLPDRLADGYDDGDEVLAIGHPRGLQFTSTTGIISQRRRDFRDRPFPFVQTDVAIDKEDKLLLRYIRPCEDLDVSDVCLALLEMSGPWIRTWHPLRDTSSLLRQRDRGSNRAHVGLPAPLSWGSPVIIESWNTGTDSTSLTAPRSASTSLQLISPMETCDSAALSPTPSPGICLSPYWQTLTRCPHTSILLPPRGTRLARPNGRH